ncbi:zinc ribbon domain-containing protein [Curvibacter gracilis]|uniref:zinc ribbon domain-containing protein n=1 Tax=Curvibacter gracilis TaxID=230310 RepID=UPI00047F7380|nr:zinc ribbon domain-containing protein [Curvibacter gracilis]
MSESTNPRQASTGGLMDLLLRSGDALQNRQALLTLVATTVGSIVIMMACVSSGVGILMGLGVLLTTLLVYAGFSATGIQLMDQAQGLEPRGLVPALMDGLFAAVKLFVLGLIAGGVVLLALLALALVLLICKIPGLGALLLALAVPVSVLALAFLFASLYFALAMVGPAVWSGATIKESLVMLWGLATRRLVGMALGMLMHTMIMGVVSVMVLGFVVWASFVVGGMGAGILNLGGSLLSKFLPFGAGGLGGGLGGSLGGDASGALMGFGFGFGILFALISAGLLLMFMLGLNRLFLHLTEGLNLDEITSKVNSQVEATRKKAEALREEARRRAEEARQRRGNPPGAGQATGAPQLSLSCPECHAEIEAGDKFCQHCGHALVGV